MKKFILALLLISSAVFAASDLRIVGVSRLPDSDFYSAGQEINFNVTMYNYGDAAGNARLEITATNNTVIECPFIDVQPGFSSTAICKDAIVIKNTTTNVDIKLHAADNSILSSKSLTLYSTSEFTKKTKVPDSNPIIVIVVVFLAAFFIKNKQ